MSTTTEMSLSSIGKTLTDVQAYAERQPVEAALEWLRQNDPVTQLNPEGYNPFWVVTRHKDVMEASRKNDLFLNGERNVILCDAESEIDAENQPIKIRTLVNVDAPDHLRLRALTQGWFMPKNLRDREEAIRTAARKSVDHLLRQGSEVDVVPNMSSTFPLHIIMNILGVPESDEERMLEWAKQLIQEQDPEMRRKLKDDPKGLEAQAAVLGDLIMYFTALTEDRRENPRDDVASVIANGEINGNLIDNVDALGYYIIIATAGHDTTSASTGGAIWQLAQDKALFDRVKADRSLIPSLIDECIRYVTPVQHFMRTASEDTELGGKQIRKGDWLLLSYLSANRDEAVFEDPLTFNIDRSPNRHLAFGFGAHLCLGQHLAKLEMRCLFEEFFDRVDAIELIGEPHRVASNFVSGPKNLPVRIIPA